MKLRKLITEDSNKAMLHNENVVITAEFLEVLKNAKTVSLNGSTPFNISELEYVKEDEFQILFSYGDHLGKIFTSIPFGIEPREMKLLNKDIINFYM